MTGDGRPRLARLLSAPALIFVVVVLGFALFWRGSSISETRSVRMRTVVSSEQVALRLQNHLTARLDALSRLRDAWRRGEIEDEASFVRCAEDIRAYHDGIVALNWIGADGVIRWVTPLRENEIAIGRDLQAHPSAGPVLVSAERSGELRVTPPLDLYQGGRGFAAYLPVHEDGELRGFFNAAFRIDPLVEDCLGGRAAEGFYHRISEGGATLHTRANEFDQAGLELAARHPVTVGDRSWDLMLWPTGGLVDRHEGLNRDAVLGFGALLALGLAILAARVVRTREELRVGRRRYRNVVHDAPALICRALPDGTITFANETYAAHVGTTAHALIGRSMLDRVPQSERAATLARLSTLTPNGPALTSEVASHDAEGNLRWRRWVDRALFDEKGVLSEFQSIGLDVTDERRVHDALRSSEERFRTIFDAVDDGILLLDVNGALVDVNERVCALYGAERARLLDEGLAGLHGLDVERFTRHVSSAAQGELVPTRHWVKDRADGGSWHAEVEFRRTTIVDEPFVVVVVRDVSERRQLEDQLRQAQKMEALGTMAGGIAHDFNNILTAISGHAELARMGISEHTLEGRSVAGILAACQQATGLTRSLLTFSRRSHTQRTIFDLVQVTRETLVLLRPLIPAAVLVSADLDPTRPLWTEGDPAQIQQVLMNLALNSRDAMPEGGVVQIGVSDSNHDVVLTVSDTGTGMSEEICRRVTEPFFTTKTRERGTGLGMSVVHGIVIGHDGSLEIDSAEGEGTSIRVLLPASGPPPELRTGPVHLDSNLVPLLTRVLLVEDNLHVRKLLASVLASNGYGVHVEGDGLVALDAYRQQRHDLDLLVFDIDLPGMNGTDCVAAIRESGGNQPVLFISGNSELDIDIAAYGNAQFLPKPFSMDRFVTAASELLAETSGART